MNDFYRFQTKPVSCNLSLGSSKSNYPPSVTRREPLTHSARCSGFVSLFVFVDRLQIIDFDTFPFINEVDWLSCCLPSSHGIRAVVKRLRPIKTPVNHTTPIRMWTRRRGKSSFECQFVNGHKTSAIKKTKPERE